MRHFLIYPATVAIAAGVGLLAGSAPALADQSINLSDCTSGWSIVNNTFNCTVGTSSTPVAPSNCSLSASKTAVASTGEQVTVTASCLRGSPAPTFSFSGITGTANGNQWSGTVTPGQTLSASASNSAASNVSAGSVTFTSSSTPNNGGGQAPGGISCSPLGTMVLPVGWPASGTSIPRALSANVGTFANDTILVVQFTTGSKNGIGRLSVAEFASGPTMRTASLSTSACGFDSSALTTRFGNGVTLYFSIGPNSYGYPALQPNTTYYFNIRNAYQDGTGSCAGGSCDVGIDLRAP